MRNKNRKCHIKNSVAKLYNKTVQYSHNKVINEIKCVKHSYFTEKVIHHMPTADTLVQL